MRARLVFALGLSVGVLATIQACGSDGGSGANSDRDGGGAGGRGHKGTGGSSGSGAREGGVSGTAGTGGTAALPCDTSACDSLLAPIQSVLGTILPLKSCCQDDKTCGIDISALAQAGSGQPTCVDPSTLTTPPPPFTISDAGVIVVPDGGAPIQLDKDCPAIVGESATPNVPPYFTLPGCCRPNGRCGGSTHTLLGAGTSVPLVCESYDDVATGSATASFANDVIIPDDPVIHCSYTAGPTVDSGAPDVVAPPPPPPPDASITRTPDASAPTPDASPTPPTPDAGPSHDAGTHADH